MGWDQKPSGRYYTRSRKVGGRVFREYIGTGHFAELAAQLDAQNREERRRQALDRRRKENELMALDTDLKALEVKTDLLAHAVLLTAGFHQHKSGEWRKKRE